MAVDGGKMKKYEWPYYRKWCCGRWVNPKHHVCTPIKSLGIVVPSLFPILLTEKQYEELKEGAEGG